MTAVRIDDRPVGLSSSLHLHVVRGGRFAPWPVMGGLDSLDVLERHGMPLGDGSPADAWRIRNQRNLIRGYTQVETALRCGIRAVFGTLWGRVTRGDTGDVEELGIMSFKLVTNNGVGYIVDAFQNLVEAENMKFHGYGTGATAEAQSDSALVTELTTQYNPDNTRPTGTTTEGASANIYRTVATLAPDSGGTIAVTEHGIFSATSAGVLLDRSLFAAVNLVAANGDTLQTTYDLTFTAGG